MNNQYNYAGFPIRFLARVTDWLILFTPQALFWWLLTPQIKSLGDLLTAIILFLAIFVFPGFLITLLYYSLTTSQWGATLGKHLAGLRVIDKKGQNLPLWRSLFRHSVGYIVSSLPLLGGYFWIIKDKKRQGWHDQISDSYVVYKNKKPAFLIGIAVAFLLTFNFILVRSSLRNFNSNKLLRYKIHEFRNDMEKILEPPPVESEPLPPENNFN